MTELVKYGCISRGPQFHPRTHVIELGSACPACDRSTAEAEIGGRSGQNK